MKFILILVGIAILGAIGYGVISMNKTGMSLPGAMMKKTQQQAEKAVQKKLDDSVQVQKAKALLAS
jgi:hypothetical protein